jgi:hypothetical protein
VTSHKGTRFESPGEPPPDFGHPSSERVQKRTMERLPGINVQHGPFAVEADEQGDACPSSYASLAVPEGLAISDS